jgi:hypothetical protein
VPAPDGDDDFVGIGDPLEGFRLGVVMIEEAIDGGLQVGDGSEDAALETALGQDGEKALDGVEPGSRGWGEVEGPAGMANEPFPRGGMLVNGTDADAGRLGHRRARPMRRFGAAALPWSERRSARRSKD